MKIIARILSTVLSPILVPAYGVYAGLQASVLTILPTAQKLWVTALAFAISGLLPMMGILVLYMSKKITDPGLNNRGERTIPYVITGLCYLGCAAYLYCISAPSWLWAFPVGGAVAVVISTIINHWWKISAHLAAMGGLVALLFRIVADNAAAPGISCWIYTAVLLTGLLATSRIILGRHTPMQVVAGTANGFICVWLFTLL